MVLLLARLAHHVLLWGKQWLSRVPTMRRRLQGYGLVRLLRDVWAVPGVIRWRHERPLGASPGGRRLSLMVPFPRPVPAYGTHFAYTRDRVP
jgi:hypothetical protein